MFLNYLALGLLLMAITLVFYGFIYIHDIPHEIAKKRKHPQTEAIHIACWLSLFTLHAIWPIVFIWACMKPNPIRVVMAEPGDDEQPNKSPANQEELIKTVQRMQARLDELERTSLVLHTGEGDL